MNIIPPAKKGEITTFHFVGLHYRSVGFSCGYSRVFFALAVWVGKKKWKVFKWQRRLV